MILPRLTRLFTQLISETNGLSLEDTLALAEQSPQVENDPEARALIAEFHHRLGQFRLNQAQIEALIEHPVAQPLEAFFRAFPLPFRDEHTHLTGSLDAEFLSPRLAELLEGPERATYEAKIRE